MAFAAGRTTRLKLGMSVMVLPGRNPVVVAKELATLDRLSGGRLLPAFGLGVADPHEQQAFGVERGERAGWFDEALAVIRSCWTDERHPRRPPLPLRRPAGRAQAPAEPSGRVVGWNRPVRAAPGGPRGRRVAPELRHPEDAAAGRAVIEQVAEEHGREIEDEHFGALVAYTLDGVPDATLAALAAAGRTSRIPPS